MKRIFLNVVMILGFMGLIVAMDRPVGQDSPAKRQKIVRSPSRIKIQTADGQEFVISSEMAKQIPVINNMIEAIGQSETIPLPVVNGAAFDWIVKNLERFYKNLPVDTEGLSVDQLIDLVNACEFLELEDLQAIVFKTLNKHPLLRESSFVAMNETALNKFWKQSPIYVHIASLLHTSLIISRQEIEVDDIISAADNRLIFWSVNQGIRILDLNNLDKGLHSLEKEMISEVVISLDGRTLASRFSEVIELEEPEGLQEEQPLQHQKNEIIKIWNLDDVNQIPLVLDHQWIGEHEDEVEFGILLNFDGTKLIARSGIEGLLKIWNLQNLAEDPRDLLHPNVSYVTISADGTMLVSSSFEDGIIKIWDMNNLNEEPSELVHERVSATIVSSNEKLISWSAENGILEIWNMKDLDQLPKQLQFKNISDVMVSSDGVKLVSWSLRDMVIQIWNMNNLNEPPQKLYFKRGIGAGFKVSLNRNELLLWWRIKGTIEIRNLNDLDEELPVLDHENVSDVVESFDGRKLISWSYANQTIRIWDMNIIDELKNLNVDQIESIIWLYKVRQIQQLDQLLKVPIPKHLKPAYASLSDSLKTMLKKTLPIPVWVMSL